MQTLQYKVSALAPEEKIIAKAASLIKSGGLVAFPTETVYGLGANALNEGAVCGIFAAKGRPANNPLIVHIVTRTMLDKVVKDWPVAAELLALYFWPGPLTLVLPRRSGVPDCVTAGSDSVAVRVPDHPVALALLHKAGCPIAAPSANPSNGISPTLAKHVMQGLGGKISAVLDGGPCKAGIESTVISLVEDVPRILRPGLITRAQLEAVLECDVAGSEGAQSDPDLDEDFDLDTPLASPGLLPRHYSPITPFELIDGSGWLRVERLLESGRKVGWMTFGLAVANGKDHPRLKVIPMPADPIPYASRLYAALHELDDQGLDRIVCAEPPDRDVWTAIRDRLKRAAGS